MVLASVAHTADETYASFAMATQVRLVTLRRYFRAFWIEARRVIIKVFEARVLRRTVNLIILVIMSGDQGSFLTVKIGVIMVAAGLA